MKIKCLILKKECYKWKQALWIHLQIFNFLLFYYSKCVTKRIIECTCTPFTQPSILFLSFSLSYCLSLIQSLLTLSFSFCFYLYYKKVQISNDLSMLCGMWDNINIIFVYHIIAQKKNKKKLWKISLEFHRLKILLATFLISSDQVQNCHGIEKKWHFLGCARQYIHKSKYTFCIWEKYI